MDWLFYQFLVNFGTTLWFSFVFHRSSKSSLKFEIFRSYSQIYLAENGIYIHLRINGLDVVVVWCNARINPRDWFSAQPCALVIFHDIIYASYRARTTFLLKMFSSMYVAVLIAVLIRPAHNEMYLFWVSHAILCTFLLLEHPLSFWHETRLIMAPTMLFTYVTYSLLPVRLQQAIIAGFILSSSQLIIELLDKRSPAESESVSYRIFVRRHDFLNFSGETEK